MHLSLGYACPRKGEGLRLSAGALSGFMVPLFWVCGNGKKLRGGSCVQLVVGFAMAMTLNRTLVMPRLVCFCDRFW